MAVWMAAPIEERARFISNIGREVLSLFPDDWLPAVAEWMASKQPSENSEFKVSGDARNDADQWPRVGEEEAPAATGIS
jgi:hypothetical protein